MIYIFRELFKKTSSFLELQDYCNQLQSKFKSAQKVYSQMGKKIIILMKNIFQKVL